MSDGNIAVAVVDYLCRGVHKVNLPVMFIMSCFVTAMSWRCYVSNDANFINEEPEEKLKGKEEYRWRRSQGERS